MTGNCSVIPGHSAMFVENFMAKKTKRTTKQQGSASSDKMVGDVLTGNRPTGFNPDYKFVIKDLRRVGILAGSFIIVLAALALILHL